MVLAKRDLLQVNATIIAGLLILLTIQSTNVSFLEHYENYESNEEKISALEKLVNETSDNILKQKTKDRIADLRIQQIEMTEDLDLQKFVIFDPMVLFLFTMILFIGSCIWEIFHADKWYVDETSRPGRIFTYFGFVSLFAATATLVGVSILS